MQLSYTDGIRSLSNLYSPTLLRDVINRNDLSQIENRIKKYKKTVLGFNRETSFNRFLELLYKEMVKNYRNEYLFKNTILNKLLLNKYGLKSTTLFSEFKIGSSIADLIFINGEVRLFEIKTNLDNLKRLDNQLNEYQKAVEKIYIVTDTKNLNEIKKRYFSNSFGIIELNSHGCLKQHKEAVKNVSFLDHKTIFKMLRKDEYLSIIKNYFERLPNVPNTKIFRESFKLIESMDILKFQKLAFHKIKERAHIETKLLDKRTPDELKLLCYVLDFDVKEYEILFKLLKRRI